MAGAAGFDAAVGALTVAIGARYPPGDIADTHDHVDAGLHGPVLTEVP